MQEILEDAFEAAMADNDEHGYMIYLHMTRHLVTHADLDWEDALERVLNWAFDNDHRPVDVPQSPA